jgi:curved DNA-binding protein CbpA
MEKTYYEEFGIKETATNLEIKQAYRKLAVKYHPDKNGGDKKYEDLFKSINNAYNILSDDIKRQRYDAKLKQQRSTAPRNHSAQNNQSQHENRQTNTWQNAGNRKSNDSKRQEERHRKKDYTKTGFAISIFIIIMGTLSLILSNNNSSTNSYSQTGYQSIPEGSNENSEQHSIETKSIYFNNGSKALEGKDYLTAILNFNHIIMIDSVNADAYYLRGLAREGLFEYSGAIEDFSKAIVVDPNFADAYNEKKKCKYHLKNHKEIISNNIMPIYKRKNVAHDKSESSYSQQTGEIHF